MTRTAEQTDDAGKDKDKDLDLTQVTAGALAAVSSAVAASYFGVAGTLLGAAFGSIVGTVSTAVYKRSIKRTNAKLREIVPIQTVVLRPLSDGTRRRPENGDTVETTRFAGGTAAPGHPATPTGSTEGDPADLPAGTSVTGAAPVVESPAAASTARASRRWWRVVAVSVAAFALALVALTSVEAVAGQTLSSWLTGTDQPGTSLGRVTTGGTAPRPAPTPTATPTTSPTATPTVTPTVTPTMTPSASPSVRTSPSPGGSASPAPPVSPAPSGSPLLP
jgi:hypothetical protein